MIGTSSEVLDWLTRHSEYAPLMQMSRQRLVALRYKLSYGRVSEDRKDEILERLNNRINYLQSTSNSTKYSKYNNIRKVRPQYTLPAIVRDHHGKFFSELTLIRMVKDEEKMRDLNLPWVSRAISRGDFPSKELVREVLNRKGWNIFEERMVLPSVWEVE